MSEVVTGYFRQGRAFFHHDVSKIPDCRFSLHVEENDRLQMHKFNMVMATQIFMKSPYYPDWDLFDVFRGALSLLESVKHVDAYVVRKKDGTKEQREKPKTWSPYGCSYAEMKRLCGNLKRLYFLTYREEWSQLEKYPLRDLVLRLTQNNTCAIGGTSFFGIKTLPSGERVIVKKRNVKIDQHHALVHNTGLDLKTYPHVKDSLVNLFAVWHDEHLSGQSWGRVKNLRALEGLERHLFSHPKLSKALNCEDVELTLNWELLCALSEFKHKLLKGVLFDTAVGAVIGLTDHIFAKEKENG